MTGTRTDQDALRGLYDRPGFQIRRAHQIAVSVFTAEMAAFGVTPTQYGVLVLLSCRPRLDQVGVAHLLGLDRSTTGMVVRTLEAAGLVVRVVDRLDRRRRTLQLTPRGRARVREMEAPASRAVERLVAPLAPAERTALAALLRKLTDAFNETARVPLIGVPTGEDG